jgi:hypothetical protein
MPQPRAKTKTHRTPTPSIPADLLADVAKLFAEHMAEKERRRFEVFERAWATLDARPVADEMRIALAVAYLGGGSK